MGSIQCEADDPTWQKPQIVFAKLLHLIGAQQIHGIQILSSLMLQLWCAHMSLESCKHTVAAWE